MMMSADASKPANEATGRGAALRPPARDQTGARGERDVYAEAMIALVVAIRLGPDVTDEATVQQTRDEVIAEQAMLLNRMDEHLAAARRRGELRRIG